MICKHPSATVVRPNIECREPLKPPLAVTATIAPASARLIETISPYLWTLNHHQTAFLMLTFGWMPVSVGFGLPKRSDDADRSQHEPDRDQQDRVIIPMNRDGHS